MAYPTLGVAVSFLLSEASIFRPVKLLSSEQLPVSTMVLLVYVCFNTIIIIAHRHGGGVARNK